MLCKNYRNFALLKLEKGKLLLVFFIFFSYLSGSYIENANHINGANIFTFFYLQGANMFDI